jgi:hypothetical protein
MLVYDFQTLFGTYRWSLRGASDATAMSRQVAAWPLRYWEAEKVTP